MLQYLLNTTAIWLLGLLCFDLFLKRETWHGYNRTYLLFTLLAGIFIPLYPRPSFTATTLTQPPLRRVDEVKNTLVQTATPEAHSFSWTTLVAWLYIAGAAISLLFLLREVWVLIRYYRNGKKSKQNGNTIIETYRDHGPFSIGKMIFVSSRKNYDDEQWQIVVQHEQMHRTLRHLADLVLVQVVQIVFWFHPLVYLYRRRLLLVHEYQADAVAAAQPLQYGHFLIEQSLLQRGPLPAHSFNRSPIKSRLHMFTKNASSKMARAKYWLLTPVLVIGLICCAKTKNAISYERKIEADKITYKGNVFGLNEPRTDTMKTKGPNGEVQEMVFTALAYPVKMNGKQIHDDAEIKDHPTYKDGSLEEKILDAVKPELEQLADADNYTISIFNTIIDEEGTLVYFDVRGLEQYFDPSNPDAGRLTIKPELKNKVAAKVNSFLEGTHEFKPAILNGKAVVCAISLGPLNFSVKDHRVTYKISKFQL